MPDLCFGAHRPANTVAACRRPDRDSAENADDRRLHSSVVSAPQPGSGPRGSALLPSLVAHRAGNRLVDLWEAERLGVACVEADIHLFRNRLEVRHLKTVGPLPLFWDRWRLAAPWHRRLLLGELVAATHESTELVLDLKGRDRRLPDRVLAVISPTFHERRFTICARRWAMLDAFAGSPVRRVYSVGTARQLRRLLERFHDRRIDGVSIHERLLNSTTVGALARVADTIMTWPVNRPERANELLALGVHALITDDTAGVAGLGTVGAAR